MAKEIEFSHTTAKTCYAQIRNSTGSIWNTAGAAFEAYLTANVADYDITATEQGTASGFYTADMPAGITTAGVYNIIAKERAGGSPAESDITVAEGTVEWSGAAVGAVAQLFAAITEGTTTFVQSFRLMYAAIVAGKTSGATSSGGTFHIRDAADSKDRVVATVDGDGNRTAITTLDGT